MTDNSGFVTTRWSLIERLGDPSPEQAKRAMDELARIYRPSVHSYIKRHVHRPELCEDLTQGFFTEVVLRRQLFSKAERRAGEPLRRLIFRSMRNYLIDAHRGRESRPRDVVGAQVAAPEDEAAGDEREFDRRWATDVLNESLVRLRAYYEERGKGGHWSLFEEWVVLPQVRHTKPAPMKDLALRHGFATGVMGSSAVQEVRRRWELLVREVVAETVSPELVEEEFLELKRVLG